MATQTTKMNVDGKRITVTVTVSDTVKKEVQKKPLQPHFGKATLVYGW